MLIYKLGVLLSCSFFVLISCEIRATQNRTGGDNFKSPGMNLLNMPIQMFKRNLRNNVNISSACIESFVDMLDMENGNWSFIMLDAMGKIPAGLMEGSISFMGSYDQCLDVVATKYGKKLFQGQYCLVSFKAVKGFGGGSMGQMAEELAETNIPVTWQGCFPSTCNENDVVLVANELLGTLGMQFTDASCEIKKDLTFDTSQLVAIVLFFFVGAFLLIGTMLDVLFIMKEKFQCLALNLRKGKVVELLISFSLYTNALKILNTKTSSDNLGALNGIRFLTMTWIILGHTYSATHIFLLGNIIKFAESARTIAFQAIGNGTVSVDVFFFLSGLLLAYVSLKELKKNKKINWFLYYFHRIWRLSPALGFTILATMLVPLFGSGPFWNLVMNREKTHCENYWWTTFLYVNNFFFSDKTCVGQTWYLANDMQFYVISPVIIYSLWRWPIAGLLINAAFLCASVVTPAILTVNYDYLPTILLAAEQKKMFEYMKEIYTKPYCRMGPYCVGIFIGYLLSKKRTLNIKPIVQGLLWCLSIGTCLAVLYGPYEWNNGNKSSTQINAFYSATHRTAFSLGIGWMTYACCTGHGGIVNRILSWAAFIPLARMTYMAYLFHPIVMLCLNSSARERIIPSTYYMVVTFLGFLVISYGVSFIASIAFEAPFINLEKVLLGRGKPLPTKPNEPEANGSHVNSAFELTQEKL